MTPTPTPICKACSLSSAREVGPATSVTLRPVKDHRWATLVTIALPRPPDEADLASGRLFAAFDLHAHTVSAPLCFDCGARAVDAADDPCPAEARAGYPDRIPAIEALMAPPPPE